MIEVILPVKDRPEVERCVQSLLKLPQIGRVLICDGGSQGECRQVLTTLERSPQVQLLQFPIAGFNKSYLLNQGIIHTSAEFVLISDADILWNEAAIAQLQESVRSTENVIGSVQKVEETHPQTTALKRDRFTYQIIRDKDSAILEIQLAINGQHRPGCGLLFTRRTNLLTLGGYKEIFHGWGWEDQDLLIRAQLLGIKMVTAGRVLHLSHADKQRNCFHGNVLPGITRNRNLLKAVNSLLQHDFWGRLPVLPNHLEQPKTMQVYLPEELRKWLYEFSGEGIPADDLSWARGAFKNTNRVVVTST